MATLQVLTDWLSPNDGQGIDKWAISTTFVIGASRVINNGDIAPYLKSYEIIRGRSSDLDRPTAGGLTLVLDSPCGMFMPLRTDSILTGSLMAGRTISLRWTHSGSAFDRFSGKTTGYTTETSVYGERTVVIECQDAFEGFQRRETRSTLYTDIKTGCLVGSILNNAEFSSTCRALDDGQETLGVAHFDRRKIDEVLVDINQTEYGNMFVRGDGYFIFHDRNFRKNASASATFADNMTEISFSRDTDNIYSEVQIMVTPTVTKSATTIWTLKSSIEVPHSDTATFWGTYIDPGTCRLVPAQGIASPIIGTEMLMNANANGTGADLSANLTASLTVFAEAFKVVASNSGTQTGYITAMTITGCPIVSYETLSRSKIDSGACAIFGKRTLFYDARLMTDPKNGDTLASLLVQRYSSPSDTDMLSIAIVNDNDTNLENILRRDIDSRITLTASAVSVQSTDYFIDRLTESWDNTGLHKAVYILSRTGIIN